MKIMYSILLLAISAILFFPVDHYRPSELGIHDEEAGSVRFLIQLGFGIPYAEKNCNLVGSKRYGYTQVVNPYPLGYWRPNWLGLVLRVLVLSLFVFLTDRMTRPN